MSAIQAALTHGATASLPIATGAPLDRRLAALAQSGFDGPATMSADGRTVALLVARPDGSAVVVGIDAVAWCADPAAWRRQLADMRAVAIAGAACYRVPLQRMDDPVSIAAVLRAAGLQP